MRDLIGHFPQLKAGEVYADWTGAALPPFFLIRSWAKHLEENLLGNPHSHHAPSARAMEDILQTRTEVLAFFHADPNEYEVIFTSGTTAAIRLLEHFMWEGGELLLTADNHNSVNGLRETARRNGAVARYAPILEDLRVDGEALTRMLKYPRSSTGHRLFAYPAKSNYSGVKHALDWVGVAQELGWSVLLDAAAFVANDRLDLSVVKPDFVPISFYKMFGYPTGVGCLIIKKAAYAKMHKKHFAGGSILLVSVLQDFFAHESIGYARFEDGTVNFANIPAVRNGLKFLAGFGANSRSEHATHLGHSLWAELKSMENSGRNRVVVHTPDNSDIVTFSMLNGDKFVDESLFERAASAAGIYVRTGCHCNPGVNERVFKYDVSSFRDMYNDAIMSDEITIENLHERAGGAPIGAIRASFGYANTMGDVRRIVDFTRQFLASL